MEEGGANTRRRQKKEKGKRQRLLEQILTRENMNLEIKRVIGNNGSAGIDGLEVGELLGYLREECKELIEQLKTGRYKP